MMRDARQLGPRPSAGATLFVVALLAATRCTGQEALLDNPPFDRIILNEANDNTVLDVYPLDLPGRQVPSPFPEGELTVRLMQRSDREYVVNWSSIQTVKLYEQLLLEQSGKLIGQQDFDEAFDLLARLLEEYPDTKGLSQGVNLYLRQNALALFGREEFDRSMAVLGALYERDSDYPGLPIALDRVAGEIIKERLRRQDYAGARAVLDLLTSQFGDVAATAIGNWEARFRQAADTKVDEARQLLRVDKFSDADRSARRAATIWPQSESAAQVLREIEQQHPQVVVGVFESSPSEPRWRIDSWPDVRVSPLLHPTLCQLEAFSTEGGVYGSPLGAVSVDDTETGRRLTLTMAGTTQRGNDVAAHALARQLLAMADPSADGFRSDYAALCQSVSMDGGAVHVEFRRPHVRPEALLLSGSAAAGLNQRGPFAIADRSDRLTRLELSTGKSGSPGGVVAIIEQTFDDDRTALTALRRGEIRMLDHVPPWQLATLEAADGITVGQYRLPTVHVLIPNPESELLQRREFRRALCFGIERQRILDELICGGRQIVGFEVVSGPFPPGSSLSDPVRYGFDAQIRPRPYSPRLAATLSLVAVTSLAKAQAAAAKNEAQPDSDTDPNTESATDALFELPEVPALVLAHSSDVLVRAVCAAIAQGLRRLGIPIELREATAEQLDSGAVEYDLRYTELAVWEPVVDAHTLFGPSGLVRGSAAMSASLRDLELAANWVDVRKHLATIHRIAHDDLPVIPLWQTVNHYAHRTDVNGVGDSLITLYQHIDDWRLEPARRRP